MNEFVLGFIGAGNMASAIIAGILNAGLLSPSEMAVFDTDKQKILGLTRKGLVGMDSASELVNGCRYVLFAVKPHIVGAVIDEIKGAAKKDNVFISISAGTTAESIKSRIGFDCKTVLVMPNTPIMLGYGASALAKLPPTSDEEFEFVKRIFSCAGVAEVIGESMMVDVIPLNGSSPAIIYYFANQFVCAAAKRGIPSDVANRLICAALIGSAKMMTDSGKSHQELIDMVCTPGGTTMAALNSLREAGFDDIMQAAIDAAIKRGYEIGK